MFNASLPTEKGEQTRSAILDSALRLFRRNGFDETRMRDIAADAGVALGAAYYYFPSKDALVQAYYHIVQEEHERRVAADFAGRKLSLRERLGIVFHSKIDILADDRKLLGAVFRYAGEPQHPLSCLGPATADTRRQSIAVLRQALEGESMPDDVRRLLPLAMWSLQMGLLVYFIYDSSPGQSRTRRLIDASLDLGVRILSLMKNPLFKPVRGKLLNLLRDADLLPDSETALVPQLVEGSK